MMMLRNRSMSVAAATFVLVVLVAASMSASAAITFGRWRDISPTDYSVDVTGTIRGVYVRNGGSGSIGAGDGWAVGGDGANPIVSRYDGFSWQIMASPIAGAVFNSAHFCTSPGAPGVGLCSANGDGSDGWIVGGAGGNMAAAYWDGSSLTAVSPSPATAGTLNSVFMVCHSPPYGTGCPGSLSAGLTYAVGSSGGAGVIYAFNGNPKAGGGWTLQFTSATATTFNGVYMYIGQSGTLEGFAVGDAGIIAKLFGGTWTEAVVGVGGFAFNAVFVDQGNPADAWAVGDAFGGSGQIWHFTTGIWTGPVSPGATANNLRGVFLTSTSEGWIVGFAGTILHSTTLGSSNAWLALQTPLQTAVGIGIDLNAVSFPSGSNGWAVGEAGVILHTENSNCQSVPSPCWGGSSSITQTTLNAVAMKGSNDAWTGGLFDTTSGITSLIHWDGNKWHRASVATLNVATPDVWGIYMLSGSEAWAVGGNAGNTIPEAMKWDGNSWTGQPSPIACACSLRGVYMISGGTSGDGWAVGTGGQILRYQSGSWLLYTTVAGAPQLNGVFISNPGSNVNAGWAVGAAGTVVKLAIVGGVPTWSLVGPILGVTADLYGVYFTDSNHGWIVGGSGAQTSVILTTTDGGSTWSGGAGQVTGAPASTVLRSVYIDTYGTGAGNGDGWAVGDDGGAPAAALYAHWDGATWVNTPLAPPPGVATGTALRSVYLTSPTDGFAVGAPITGGTLAAIIHLDPPNPPTQPVTVTTTQSTSTTSSVTSSTATDTATSTSTVEATITSSTEQTTSETGVSSETTSTTPAETVTITESSTSSTTTPLVMPAVPGFPVESILAGVAIGLGVLVIIRRRRK